MVTSSEGDIDTPYLWQFDGGEFDSGAQRLTINGVQKKLEPKAASVLALMLRRTGEVVTKSELLASVWDNRPTVDNVVSTALGKARKALGTASGITIVTVARMGYRLDGVVSRSIVRTRIAEQSAPSIGDPVPNRTGFRLSEKLSSGLGNEVWLAVNNRTSERRVYEFASDSEQLLTLKRERAAFGLLKEALVDRSEIVEIKSSNFSHPPYFLESEFAGQNLQQWSADELQPLNLDERLAIFLQIARTVADVHGVGVLHKDIKPSNVLLQPDPEGGWLVKLTGFGISRLPQSEELADFETSDLDAPQSLDLTTVSSAQSSPYVAPEVLVGQAQSIRSDVYALGLLLYQLIVGDLRRSLVPGWEREVFDPLLRADIAAATDVDPSKRLATAEDLAERVTQLEPRRIEAQRRRDKEMHLATAQAALLRARNQRPWIYATIALLFLALTLSIWLYNNAESERLAALEFVSSAVAVQRFLADDLLAQANSADLRYDPEGGLLGILRNASKTVEERFGEDPLALAALHRALAGAYRGLGALDEALFHYRRAANLYAKKLGAENELVLEVQYRLVYALSLHGQFAEAEDLLKHTDALASAQLAKASELALLSAMTHALVADQQLKAAEALDGFRRVEALLRAGVPDKTGFEPMMRLGMADALMRIGNNDEALQMLRKAENGRAQLTVDHQPRLDRLLSRALRAKNEFGEAVRYAENAVKGYRRHSGVNHWNSLVALSTLSYAQFLAGDCDSSVDSVEQAYEGMRENIGPDQQGTLIELGNRGSRRFECGHQEDGLKDVAAARAGLREKYGNDNVPGQSFSESLARYLGQVGRHAEGLDILDSLDEDAVAAIQAGGTRGTSAAKLNLLRARLLLGAGEQGRACSLASEIIEDLRVEDDLETLEGARTLLRKIAEDSPAIACTLPADG